MGNIGKRERYYLMLLGIVIAVLLIYYFGIRNLGIKYDEMVDTRSQLQAQLDYYEALKTQNDEALAQINQLKNEISEAEARFLPNICSEAIEQYVLKTFEDAGCPYLVSVSASDIAASGVTLPDGSSASDSLLIKRITVQYSTTDGFCIPEYNRNVTVVVDGMVDEAEFNALLEEMYWHGADSRVGYDEFRLWLNICFLVHHLICKLKIYHYFTRIFFTLPSLKRTMFIPRCNACRRLPSSE